MKTLKRWTSTIVASFDHLVGQIENHEALVNSAIRDIQEAGGRAKAQLNRVRNDGARLRGRLIELRDSEERWKQRAVTAAPLDQARALECLRRRKKLQQQIGEFEQQEREHARIEKQLAADLQLIEERLVTLKQKRNLMRTRQSRAEALKLTEGDEGLMLNEIADIFDRWEAKVCEYEFQGSCAYGENDDLESEFATAEEEAELRAVLAELAGAPGGEETLGGK